MILRVFGPFSSRFRDFSGRFGLEVHEARGLHGLGAEPRRAEPLLRGLQELGGRQEASVAGRGPV